MTGEKKYLTEHVKYNVQFCPKCHSYNVVYKKKLEPLFNLWRCKDCKNEFSLPNKYNFLRLGINLNGKEK